jgi:hypothetical protein
MILKGLAVFALLIAMSQPPLYGLALAGAVQQQPAAAAPGSGSTAANSDCSAGPCDYPAPHVSVAYPPRQPEQWLLRDQILWGANLLLAILGYAGIMVALSALRKIQSQTKSAETISEAALNCAQAALLSTQAIINSERPWLLITIEPSPTVENSFSVKCRNRGHTPATIIAASDQVRIEIDESYLPATPEFEEHRSGEPFVPIILLPGESTALKQFARTDVRGLCETDARFRRIETWEEKIFIYGKVLYQDLITPSGTAPHETSWCCWFIYGRQKSGMVIAGPQGYNLHT